MIARSLKPCRDGIVGIMNCFLRRVSIAHATGKIGNIRNESASIVW